MFKKDARTGVVTNLGDFANYEAQRRQIKSHNREIKKVKDDFTEIKDELKTIKGMLAELLRKHDSHNSNS